MKKTGFTLAELLIALAILGVIATFTIPKVLNSQQDTKKVAIAKEAAGTITSGYDALKQTLGGTYSSLGPANITPYFNYVKIESSMVIDGEPGTATYDCSDVDVRCMRLHNGAILLVDISNTFSGTATTNAVPFILDPDGSNTGTQDSLWLFLYTNTRLVTYGSLLPNTYANGVGPMSANTAKDPAWFKW